MIESIDLSKSDKIAAADLTGTDLGKTAVVTKKDNTVIGPLQAYTFSDYRVHPKHGPIFNVSVTLGDIELYVDHMTDIWLSKD